MTFINLADSHIYRIYNITKRPFEQLSTFLYTVIFNLNYGINWYKIDMLIRKQLVYIF